MAGGLARILVVVAVAVFLRRRFAAYLRRWRTALRSRITNPTLRIFAARWLGFAAEVAPAVILLATVYLGFAVVSYAGSPELVLIRALLLAYAWYRVLLTLAHNLLTNSAAGGLLEIPPELSARILGSVRMLGLYLLAVVVFLTVAGRLVGRGYLYGLVVDFFWVGALPIGFIQIRRWRDDIAEAYLKAYPQGRLAEAVNRHRHRRTGFFVTFAAFGYVAARGLVRSLGDVVLRFRHARQAIMFLLERRSHATVGLGESLARPALPPALVQALTEDPPPPALIIDHFPHLDEVERRLLAWRAGGPAVAVALVGDRGGGKSTWLAELGRRQAAAGGRGDGGLRRTQLDPGGADRGALPEPVVSPASRRSRTWWRRCGPGRRACCYSICARTSCCARCGGWRRFRPSPT